MGAINKIKYYLFLVEIILFSILNPLSAIAQNIQENFTGNWKGVRDSLESNGLSISPRLTFFYQNYLSDFENDESVFSGKVGLEINFNGKKMGLKRWTLISKTEHNFGNSLSGKGYTLLPQNTAMIFPGARGGNYFDISSLYLQYHYEKNVLLFGKINMIDLAGSTRYSGGSGLDTFWNLAFVAPPSGITPPYIFGAISVLNSKLFKYTFMVYDPVSAIHRSGFESPFSKGIVLSASFQKDVSIGNKKGYQSIRIAYSSQDGKDLYTLGDIFPPVNQITSDKKNRYYFNYTINQPLIDLKQENKSIGLFGQIAISDGNPNPIYFSFLAGIGGNSFLKNRSQDNWGIAFYNYQLSDAVWDYAYSKNISIRSEKALEFYYQAFLWPYFSLGVDVQYIDPVVKSTSNVWFLGLRSNIHL